MEPLGLGAFPDGEWDWFHRIFAIEGQDYLPSRFFNLSSSLLPGDEDRNTGMQSMFSSNPESQLNEIMLYSFDALNSNFRYISQESSNSGNSSCGYTNTNFCNSDQVLPNDTCASLDFYMMDDEKSPASFVPSLNDIVIDEENVSLNEDERSDGSEKSDHCKVEPIVPSPSLKRKLDMPALEVPEEDKIINTNSSGGQRKKPRASKDVQRCVKNARSKKNQKPDTSENEAEETNAGSDGHGSSSYNSEDDNANQENSGGATSTLKSPKTRASRGSATDPQSLYARKRRERINERLRILQCLVPNGTKVDISTMLEEAVHYVKFLKLQIKLLSSDDLWMYAPIAYNGIDIGLNLSRKDYSTAMS